MVYNCKHNEDKLVEKIVNVNYIDSCLNVISLLVNYVKSYTFEDDRT